MEAQMRIDPSLIPPAEMRNLAATFLEAAKRFYENPENVKEFKEWQEKRRLQNV